MTFFRVGNVQRLLNAEVKNGQQWQSLRLPGSIATTSLFFLSVSTDELGAHYGATCDCSIGDVEKCIGQESNRTLHHHDIMFHSVLALKHYITSDWCHFGEPIQLNELVLLGWEEQHVCIWE